MELQITQPIKKDKNPINVYVLHVHIMHGDADFNEVHTQRFSDNSIEKLKKYISALKELKKVQSGATTLYSEVLQKYGESIGDEEIAGNISDLIPGDKTVDGQFPACVEDLHVTYFDTNGIEYDVEITE